MVLFYLFIQYYAVLKLINAILSFQKFIKSERIRIRDI